MFSWNKNKKETTGTTSTSTTTSNSSSSQHKSFFGESRQRYEALASQKTFSSTSTTITERRISHTSSSGSYGGFGDSNRQLSSFPIRSSFAAFNSPSLFQNDARPFTNSISFNNNEPISQSEQLIPSATSSTTANNNNATSSSPNIRSQSATNIVPTYKHTKKFIGKALVINNIKFIEKQAERKGAEKDSTDLEKLLKKIGFEVKTETNVSANKMTKLIKDFSKSDFSKHNISLIVIMSHGSNQVLNGNNSVDNYRGGFTQVIGVDNMPVVTEDLVQLFTLQNAHKSLKCLPKIFIFQCCRGQQDMQVCTDAVRPKKSSEIVKDYSDILIAHSTLPGYVSNRSPENGTWYIQSICKIFEANFRKLHLEEMLKIVDTELSLKHPTYAQTSTYESRGFKTCFLHKNS